MTAPNMYFDIMIALTRTLLFVLIFLVATTTVPTAASVDRSQSEVPELTQQSSDHAFRQGTYGLFILIIALLLVGYAIHRILSYEVPPHHIENPVARFPMLAGYAPGHNLRRHGEGDGKRSLEGRSSVNSSTGLLPTSVKEALHGSPASPCNSPSKSSPTSTFSVSALDSPIQITSPLPGHSSPGRFLYQEAMWPPATSPLRNPQLRCEVDVGVGVKGLPSYPPRSFVPPSNKQPTLCLAKAAPQGLPEMHIHRELDLCIPVRGAATNVLRSGTHAAWV